MRELAGLSGVTLPTIYHHFNNKQDLFLAVEKELYDAHAQDLLNTLKAEAPPEQKLHDFMIHLMLSFERHPAYFKILHRNLVDGKTANQAFLSESLQRVYDELKSLLEVFTGRESDGLLPIMIFTSIVGYETMRPAIASLASYPYAGVDRATERTVIAEAIMAVIAKS